MRKKIVVHTKAQGPKEILLFTQGDALVLRVRDASNEAEVTLNIAAAEILHDAIQTYFGECIINMDLPLRLSCGLGRRFDWEHYPS